MVNANIIVPLVLICSFSFLHKLFLNKQHKRKQKQNVLKHKVEGDIEFLSDKIETQEETFRNISSEIHDNICLTLSLANLYLNNPPNNTEAELHDKVNMSAVLVRKAIAELNRLSKSLNPDVVEKFGLIRSVEVLVSDIQQVTDLKITFSINGITRNLDTRAELCVYRVVQESLNNVIKHAHAGVVQLVFDFYSTHLIVTIADDGVGFNANMLSGGAGLANMRRRASVLNGVFVVESRAGVGTSIKLSIPLNIPQTTCKQKTTSSR